VTSAASVPPTAAACARETAALRLATPDDRRDLSHLDTLPLSRVIDYRDPHEVQRSPDRLNERMRYLNAPPIR
jgi:protein tyrosine/serine phosphatase